MEFWPVLGEVVAIEKRAVEPVIYVAPPGCELHDAVKMDAFGISDILPHIYI